MLVSQVTPISMNGVSPIHLTPIKAVSSYQAPKTTEISAPKPYEVELTGAAQAKSLKLQGYSVMMIALKMGLNLTLVNQYLGITDTSSKTTTKTTYTQPKAAYTEPRTLSLGREQLAQDLNEMTFAQFTWSNMMSSLSNMTS